ncbi:MAG: ATP-binding protein, partial [Ferruginibacter sp.]
PANIIAFQFRQLMLNLVSNALKFSRPGVPLHIFISSNMVKESEIPAGHLANGKEKIIREAFIPEKNYCHICVSDNGIGFEPQFSELIFGVFQKLHSKEVYPGTGIGLAIVKKIVENHRGHIKATGELNKGATFDIYIPSE